MSLLWVTVVAFAIVSTVAISRAGVSIVAAARAQAVADAVALAAAAHGAPAAERIATANEASLRSLHTASHGTVRVEVTLGGVRASAAATTAPR
jgi:hypothetical protein